MTRQSVHLLGRLLIGVLLYGQMAIAAYACPGLAAAAMNMQMPSVTFAGDEAPDKSTAQADVQVVDCNGMGGSMDPSSPALCAEHCRFGQQSDLAPTVSVPVVLITTLYVTPPVPELSVPPHPGAAATSALAVAFPPHAILHCCFRI